MTNGVCHHPFGIDVATLRSAPAHQLADPRAGSHATVRFGERTPAVPVVRLTNVHFQPSVLAAGQGVQITATGVIPTESSYYDYVGEFVRNELIRRGIERLEAAPLSDHDGDVCILANVFSRNFTHWHEELMKVVVLERSGLQCHYVLSGLPEFSRSLLRLIGIPDHRVLEVSSPVRFRSVLVPAGISYDNIHHYPAVFFDLRERLLSACRGTPSPAASPRLWLERGAQTRLGRGLVNGEDVSRLLTSYGITAVDFGALAPCEQLALARDAELMVGLHGSPFVHTQLMAAGSPVVECFSPLYLNPTYTNIYRLLHHRYSLVVTTNTRLFPYACGEDVLVDIPQFEHALEMACRPC